MLSLAQKHVRSTRWLGQAPARTVRAVVVDMRGRSISGAEVSAWSNGTMVASAVTDSSGQVQLPLTTGSYDIRTIFGSERYVFWSQVSDTTLGRGGDIFIEVPVCSSQPLLTTSEAITLGLGAVVACAGFYYKVDAAKVTGEVLLGAAVFTAIYRMSCL